MRLWEGLGYYRRARQLHLAARKIVEQHRGICPRSLEDWRALPGVGRYTAGAILSIADGQPTPILEGNTQRLYCRLLGWEGDPRRSDSQKLLWEFAAWLLATDLPNHLNPGDLNQSLMEIGNRVCTPTRPDCSRCPLLRLCPTAALRAQDRIPCKAIRPQTVNLHQAAIVARRVEVATATSTARRAMGWTVGFRSRGFAARATVAEATCHAISPADRAARETSSSRFYHPTPSDTISHRTELLHRRGCRGSAFAKR